MLYLILLLRLVFLNSMEQSGYAAANHVSCGDHVTTGADVTEVSLARMVVSHSLMQSKVELLPNFRYDVRVISEDEESLSILGFSMSAVPVSSNDTVTGSNESAHDVCPLNTDQFKLPYTVTWDSPEEIESCVTLKMAIFFNSSSIQELSSTVCPPTGCFEYITNTSGVVTSPMYPDKYPDDVNCSIYIVATEGQIIDIQFQFVKIEQSYSTRCFDWLEVHYNNLTAGPYCGTWSREALTELRFLANQLIKIEFLSDNKISNAGFLAAYQISSLKECEKTFHDTHGIISSPNFPDLYFPNARCVFSIALPSDYRIRVKIFDLDLGREGSTHGKCVRDKLQIFDPVGENRTLCGSLSTYAPVVRRYESAFSTITIVFQSDHVGEFSGFNLTYIGVISCHNVTFNADNGTVTSVNFPSSYPNNQECFYTINTSDRAWRIELIFDVFHTESRQDIRYRNQLCDRDYVEIFDERGQHRICGNWSGQEHLLMFRSQGSSLLFRFVSDDQVTRRGFYATWRTVEKIDVDECESTSVDNGTSVFYHIIYRKQNWFESNIDCQSRGGHLVTIADLPTQTLLNQHLKESNCSQPEDAFWIGASDFRYESDFYWTDGTKVKFTDWFKGWLRLGNANQQPSDDGFSEEDCVELRETFHFPHKGLGCLTDYKWNDRSCSAKNGYVCQCYKGGQQPPPRLQAINCDQTLKLNVENSSLSLTSPGYPGNYGDFLECWIIVLAPSGFSLRFTFHDLQLEESKGCKYDYLTVSNVPWNSSFAENSTRLCGNWTRKSKLLDRVVPGNVAFLHLSTDHSFNFPGFNFTSSLINDTDLCNKSWWFAGQKCVQMRSLPPSKDETICPDTVILETTNIEMLFLVAFRLLMNNGSNEVTLWTGDEGGACRGLASSRVWTMEGVVDGDRLLQIPTHVQVSNVSCCNSPTALCYVNSRDNVINKEDHLLTDPEGRLSNPGYPTDLYEDLIRHSWRFQSNNSSRILFTLHDLDIEFQDNCLYDWIKFTRTVPDGRFCGTSNITRYFLSRDNSADVSLASDREISGRGFLLSWVWLDMNKCQRDLLTDQNGTFNSFNFPFAFPDVLDCVIIIRAPGGSRIFIQIDYLYLPKNDDRLIMSIGADSSIVYRNTSVIRMPLRLLSISTEMTLTLQSDSVLVDAGFMGSYIQIPADRRAVPTEYIRLRSQDKASMSSLNTPLPYPYNHEQTVVIRAPVGHVLVVNFHEVHLRSSDDCSSDVLTVTDISLSRKYRKVLMTSCNYSTPHNLTSAVVVSVYNRLELRFVSAEYSPVTDNGRYSAVVEAIEDSEYLNKTAGIDGIFDSCDEMPCHNEGQCEQLSQNEAKCVCPGYYTGLFCQVTHCQLNPCMHGACTLTPLSYVCTCNPGYWGSHCDLDPRECDGSFCGGKGTCVGNNSDAPQCQCGELWEGPSCSIPLTESRTPVPIGQRLLGEPIWIGLIVILSMILAFGIFYVIRRKCGKHFTCCDVTPKKEPKAEPKPTPSGTPTPPPVSFSELKARRCSVPPPILPPPIISITRAGETCVPNSDVMPGERDVAARFFASYKEAERTPISAPVAVNFSRTTATSMASDSDDNSIVGGLVGGTLAFAGSRQQKEELQRRESIQMLKSSCFLQAPAASTANQMKHSHSMGPYLVRQTSLYDGFSLSQKTLDSDRTSSEHLFPTVIVSNEDGKSELVDPEKDGSIQIYLNDPAELGNTPTTGIFKQISKSDGSINERMLGAITSRWKSRSEDGEYSRAERLRNERTRYMTKSESVDYFRQHRARRRSRLKTETNSMDSSSGSGRCRRSMLSMDSNSDWQSHRRLEEGNCTCNQDDKHYRSHHRRIQNRTQSKVQSCCSLGQTNTSNPAISRASSTENEHQHRFARALQKRSRSNRSRHKNDALSVLNCEHDMSKEAARREMFRKFFSQDIQFRIEPGGTSEDTNYFRFPDLTKQETDLNKNGNDRVISDASNNGATCRVIMYDCPRRTSNSSNVTLTIPVEKSSSQDSRSPIEEHEKGITDSAIYSSETMTSSCSLGNNNSSSSSSKTDKKAPASLLTVDTDSTASSASKSFQSSPYHESSMSVLTNDKLDIFCPDVRVKDSAYESKQSSIDVGGITERPNELLRKLSLPTNAFRSELRNEESHVTQRLHQVAHELSSLQLHVRRTRFSKESAVHRISEDDQFHRENWDEMSGGLDMLPLSRFKRDQAEPGTNC